MSVWCVEVVGTFGGCVGSQDSTILGRGEEPCGHVTSAAGQQCQH